MYVNTHSLHTGANSSAQAGEHAGTGADRLSVTGLVTGMFGDFDAAQDFHDALQTAKDHHTTRLRQHQENLTDIAGKARIIATDFTEMENHNAQRLRDVVVDDNR